MDHIDHVFYINLKSRQDRKGLIEAQLEKYGLKAERFDAIYNPGSLAAGCMESHLKVLKIAKERGYKNVLILEDDFHFVVDENQFVEQLDKFFTANIEYDVCFLSYHVIRAEKTQYDFIQRAVDCRTASGYLVNQHYYDKLIDLFATGLPKLITTRQHWIYANDVIWQSLQQTDNWYLFTPRIGVQRESYSDLARRVVNYNC